MTFFEKRDRLHLVLQRHDGRASALPEIAELLEDNDVCRDFLMNLKDPSWVQPLREYGIFDSLPRKETLPDGSVRYPLWPQSKYLMRISDKAPSEVEAILSNIQTDNYTVIEDVLQAALKMPTGFAVKLVPALCNQLQNAVSMIHIQSASKLCVQLAASGEQIAAMTLAESLFAPKSDHPDGRPGRNEEYWYKEGLKTVVPTLSTLIPRTFLPALCSWLEMMILQSKVAHLDSDSDSSYLWRPAIEEHAENSNFEVKGVMVASVANGFESAIRSDAVLLLDAVQILSQFRFVVFKRVQLHLIRIFGAQTPDLVSKAILDMERFDDPHCKHEYALLVGQWLDKLENSEREEWWSWIDAGPDMSGFDDSIRTHLRREATEDDRQARIDYWKFEKLHWVRNILTGGRKEFYEQMLASRGEPEFSDLNIRFSTRWGNESPMTEDELAAIPFPQAVEAVSSWQPSDSHRFGPNVAGLASTFELLVKANSEEASKHAMLLAGKRSIYVRYFLRALADAVRSGSIIQTKSVLELCKWVIQHPIEDSSEPDHEDIDEKWLWTVDEISRLIVEVCRADQSGRPTFKLDTLRSILWDLIVALVEIPPDPDHTHDEDERDPRLIDYRERGINSTRGKALEAAFAYARWVAKHLDKSHEGVPGGFEAMPEVISLLEMQLSPEKKTVEGMSIIGREMGLLYWIDKKWLASNVDRLFDVEFASDPMQTEPGWSAWNSFVTWVSPHSEYYRLFKSKYAFAIEQAAKVAPREGDRAEPMYRLGKHLMLYYGNGVIGLQDADSMILRFLETANAKLRRNAVAFVGDSLAGDKVLPKEVIERFVILWDKYWQTTGQLDAAGSRDGDLFGTWFASGKFSPQWSIDRLEAFIEANPKPEPSRSVVERLAETCTVDVEKTIHILSVFVENDVEGWRVDSWLEPARTILRNAMAAGGSAREQAERLIDRLGRNGYVEFGALLKAH